jgi:hypothetical protein
MIPVRHVKNSKAHTKKMRCPHFLSKAVLMDWVVDVSTNPISPPFFLKDYSSKALNLVN